MQAFSDHRSASTYLPKKYAATPIVADTIIVITVSISDYRRPLKSSYPTMFKSPSAPVPLV
jgi:hypothetical protein